MFKGKRQSFGTAIHYLKGRQSTFRRYLQRFYPPYDWSLVKHFFWDNPIQAKAILEDFQRNNDSKIDFILNNLQYGKSKICIIVGARGGGKTSLVFFIAEKLHERDEDQRIYFVAEGMKQIGGIFPKWIRVVDGIDDVKDGSLAIVDEASLKYSARRSMNDENVLLSGLIATARHHDLTIIFITQHLSMIEVNAFRMRDILFHVKSSDYSFGDRGNRKDKANTFWDRVRNMMMPREVGECLFEMPTSRRFINFKYTLPEFWSDDLSKAFKGHNAKEQLIRERIERAREEENRKLDFLRKKAEIEAEVYAQKGIKRIVKKESSDEDEIF